MDSQLPVPSSSEPLEQDEEPPSAAPAYPEPYTPPQNQTAVVIPVRPRPRPSYRQTQLPLSPLAAPPIAETKSLSPAYRFRRMFYPRVKAGEWNDWRWQLRNRIRDLTGIERVLVLTDDERMALSMNGGALPFAVTPYYCSLLSPDDPAQPLRRSAIPTMAERQQGPGEADDPLSEDAMTPVPGLVHRYPDRALFLASETCAVYCRYCTRSRMVGHGACPGAGTRLERWQRALDYVEATPAIRDVLVSGGDPLTMDDESIEWILSRLRRIRHVEFVRIGTKVPVVLPQRITPHLIRMLRRYHPLWVSIHFTHPDELTPETVQACARLADAGIPLGSQTVLLKGVNDNVETMKRLVHGLLKARVRPYYLYQCDPITGSAHFRTPVEKGLEIIQGLRGYTTGYGVPTYVIDAPGGGGKIPIAPNYVVGRIGDDLLLRNYEGKQFRYPDPAPAGV